MDLDTRMAVYALFFWLLLRNRVYCEVEIPTTLEGPFEPVTVHVNNSWFMENVIDLPVNDSRLGKPVVYFEPQQISVSLSYRYDSVWISWITGEFQIGDCITPLNPESVQSVVQYGVYRKGITHEATGYSLVYSQQYRFEGLQNYTSGIIHHVQLTGLQPDTLYQYRCGDPSIPVMSDVHYFKTMPVSSSDDYPGGMAVAGNLGLTYNTSSTLSHLLSIHPDLLILVGGLSYADNYFTNGSESFGTDCYSCSFTQTPIRETYQPRWDYWGRFMQPLLASVPTMMVGGENEIEEQADNRRFVAYSNRFTFPSEESGSSSVLYYSFNAGGIHFVMLSAYISYDKSSDQYRWLENDLDNVDRLVTPWLVASWHPSWYSTFKAHYREAECMRLEMEDLLYAYGVDIVFNGHVHAYERSNRVYNYTLDQCGPVYITVGDGGNGEMAFEHADQQPEYSAYRESSFGYGLLEVKNETHALWTWHRNSDSYLIGGDIIYIVREPDKCSVKPKEVP